MFEKTFYKIASNLDFYAEIRLADLGSRENCSDDYKC